MSAARGPLAVILCSCGGTLFDAEAGRRIVSAFPGVAVLVSSAACAPAESSSLAAGLGRLQAQRAVFAGCSAVERPEAAAELARKAGLTAGAVRVAALRGPGAAAAPGDVPPIVAAVGRALRQLELQPELGRRRITLHPGVLVVGDGPAAVEAARRARDLGHETCLVRSASAEEPLEGARVLSGSRLLRLDGQVGAFEARARTPAGEERLSAGAVIVAGTAALDPALPPPAAGAGQPGPGPAAALRAAPAPAGGPVLDLDRLEEAAAALPPRRGTRSVGILLDFEIDEPRGAAERALQMALRLQQPQRTQVYLLCRDLRVSALPLEELYDRARQAGVIVVKHSTPPRWEAGAGGVELAVRDEVLGRELRLECVLLGVSRAQPPAGAALGISTDGLGRLQENNVHLFPEATNRPGVFVVGPARGEDYLPQALREARVAALAAHRLLAPGFLEVELSNALVDADRCALCLTCIRSCPFGAMRIAADGQAAESLPEVCRRCGVCAGECPARAIELPLYSDRILMEALQA